MSSNVDLHVLYRIGNAPVQVFPYPHVYVPDIFPADFYREMRENLLPPENLQTLQSLNRVSGAYPETRLVLPLTPDAVGKLAEPRRSFWTGVCQWLLSGTFGQIIVSKFAPYLSQRFGDLNKVAFSDEALLVQDHTRYALGPHTDAPSKVMSFLFYLPADDSKAHLGTSIYVPNDPNFTCPGGPHHDFGSFRRMMTMPYLPNTLFAFMKTPNAFHGVEPIADAGVRRDLLLYDIRARQAAPAAPKPAVNFSF